MKIPANKLSAHLNSSLLPCYLVAGDEHLLVQEALDSLREAARQRGFGSRDLQVSGPGFDWGELAAAGSNLSLFAEKQIVELRIPTGKPGRQGGAAIVDLVGKLHDELLLIVSTPKLDRNTANSKWAKALQSEGALVQIWPVDRRELPSWIAARMRHAGLQPERDAVSLIADRVEGNLLAAQQEIEKLRLIRGEGRITVADVDDAVADSSRFDVYKLVDAAVAGDTARAMRILGGVRVEGVEAVIVIWALTRELRMLAGLTEAIAAGEPLSSSLRNNGVWKTREGIVRACVSRHNPADMYRLLQLARLADSVAKGQSGSAASDPWQLATAIILGLSRGTARAA